MKNFLCIKPSSFLSLLSPCSYSCSCRSRHVNQLVDLSELVSSLLLVREYVPANARRNKFFSCLCINSSWRFPDSSTCAYRTRNISFRLFYLDSCRCRSVARTFLRALDAGFVLRRNVPCICKIQTVHLLSSNCAIIFLENSTVFYPVKLPL